MGAYEFHKPARVFGNLLGLRRSHGDGSFSFAEILFQPFEQQDFVTARDAGLIPIIDLETDEHTEDNDQRLDHDGEPVLLAQRGRQAPEDHYAASSCVIPSALSISR